MSPGRIRLGGGSQPPASAKLLLQGEHKDCCPDRRHGRTPFTPPCTPQSAYPASHMQTHHTSQLYAKLRPKARRQVTARSPEENNKITILPWVWGVLLARSHVCVVLKRALPQYYERAAAKIICDKETVDNSRHEIWLSKPAVVGHGARVRHWAAPRRSGERCHAGEKAARVRDGHPQATEGGLHWPQRTPALFSISSLQHPTPCPGAQTPPRAVEGCSAALLPEGRGEGSTLLLTPQLGVAPTPGSQGSFGSSPPERAEAHGSTAARRREAASTSLVPNFASSSCTLSKSRLSLNQPVQVQDQPSRCFLAHIRQDFNTSKQ